MICEHGREIFWKKAIIKSSRPKRANKAKWEGWKTSFGPGTLMKTGVVWDRWCKLAFEYWTVTLWGQTVSNWNTKTELISQDLRFVGNFTIYFKHPSMAKRGKVACMSARFPFFIERNPDRMSKLAHLEWNKVLPWGIKSPLLSAALRTPSFSSIFYPPWPSLDRGGKEITFVILNHSHAFPLNSNG